MKDLIGKAKITTHHCHKKSVLKRLTYLTRKIIVIEFSRFFANVVPILAKQIPDSENTFESYLVKTSAIMQYKSVSINELGDAFFSLKLIKSPGYDEISFNVVKKCFSELCEPLKHIFNLSIVIRVYPDKLKIAHVSPVYKVGIIFPKFLKEYCNILYSPMRHPKKICIQNNSVFNLAI